jgi:hypothetical protein
MNRTKGPCLIIKVQGFFNSGKLAAWIPAFEAIRILMALPKLPRGKIGYIEKLRPRMKIDKNFYRIKSWKTPGWWAIQFTIAHDEGTYLVLMWAYGHHG